MAKKFAVASCSDHVDMTRKGTAFAILGYASTEKAAKKVVLDCIPAYNRVWLKDINIHIRRIPVDHEFNRCGEEFWQYFICEKGAFANAGE